MLRLSLPRDNNGIMVPDILANFTVADIDDANPTKYYGYLAADGSWLIQKYDSEAGTIRWVFGKDGYPEAWTNRGTASYDYFNNIV